MNWRVWVAVTAPMFLSACSHVSDQAIVDNCRAGGGLTVATCECVRSEMKGALDAYSYDAMVLLANGRDDHRSRAGEWSTICRTLPDRPGPAAWH